MSEHGNQEEEGGLPKHALYLVGLITLGLVFYSLAAYAGLEFAKRSAAEKESDASRTVPSSEVTTPIEAEGDRAE